jgi:hypothetical protein
LSALRAGQEVAWPGGGKEPRSADDLFELLAEWDTRNYVVCAATKEGACGAARHTRCRVASRYASASSPGARLRAGSDKNATDGIVDGHAYSLIAVKKQVRCVALRCIMLHLVAARGAARCAASTTS